MKTLKKLFSSLFGGLILIGAVCLGWVLVGHWLPALALEAPLLQKIFCCDPLNPTPIPGLPPGLRFFHLVGMGLMAIGLGSILYKVWQTTRYTTRLLKSSPADFPVKVRPILSELNIHRHVVVIPAADPFALCFGFLRPRICLSSGLIEALSPDQIRAVLCHEERHRQRLDPLRILILEGVQATFFFMPLILEWCANYKIKLELEADNYAVDLVGKSSLAGALYRLISCNSSPALKESGAVTVGLGSTAARVAELLGEGSAPKQISQNGLLRSIPGLLLICLLLTL